MQPFATLLPMRAERTTLRLLRTTDTDNFHAYRSDSDLARFQGWSPMSRDSARQFVDEMSHVQTLRVDGWIQLGVADAETDRLVGDVGLFLTSDQRAGEVGFTVSREAQGVGHATRALRAALALLFAASPALTVRGITDARNRASVRVLERAGFALSHAQKVVFKGEACTELVYVRSRADA